MLPCIPFIGNILVALYDVRGNKKVMATLTNFFPKLLRIADETIRSDIGFNLDCLRKNPDIWLFLSKDLKNNEKFMLQAINKNPESMFYANNQLKSSINFAVKAGGINLGSLQYFYLRILQNQDSLAEILSRVGIPRAWPLPLTVIPGVNVPPQNNINFWKEVEERKALYGSAGAPGCEAPL